MMLIYVSKDYNENDMFYFGTYVPSALFVFFWQNNNQLYFFVFKINV